MLLLLPYLASAWWDEGHMLIASVARNWLTEPADPSLVPWTAAEGNRVVRAVDSVFNKWHQDFPQYTDLVSAAVWADHIKCRYHSEFCSEASEHYDGIQIFNENHFVDIYYSVGMSEAEMDGHVKSALQRKDNAAYLLKTITDSLASKYVNSYFSINLLLRLFLHIFGDIHQPLHAMTYATPTCFPNTDHGGNQIQVKIDRNVLDEADRTLQTSNATPGKFSGGEGESDSVYMSLHALWDSGGSRFGRSYPAFPVHDSNEMARLIIERYPNVTNKSYVNVIRESYALAPSVYTGIINQICNQTDSEEGTNLSEHRTTGPDTTGLDATGLDTHGDESRGRGPVASVDLEYLQRVRRVTEERIALAGYSLAFYLNDFARGVEEDQFLNNDIDTMNWWKVYSVAVTFTLMFLVLYFKCYRANRQVAQSACSPYGHSLPNLNDNIHLRRSRRYKTHMMDSISCATSDNASNDKIDLEEQLMNPGLGVGLNSDYRVLVSDAHVAFKPRVA